MTGPSPKIPKHLDSFDSLKQIVDTIRGPGGCPWDQEQTHLSLTQYAVEETMELVEALESGQDALIKEELGDVLFQVLLHTTLAEERQAFTMKDVIRTIAEKLVRRHPHVFADVAVKNSQEVIDNWEKIKKKEKGNQQPKGFNLPAHLPALQMAYKIGRRTEKSGFDWESAQDTFAKVKEELHEFEEELTQIAQNKKRVEEELGDLFFALAQVARHLEIEPETALRRGNQKFENRYFTMIRLATEAGLDFEKLSLAEKESFWQQAKSALK